MQPHRWQPTRLPRPWDSPGKTGVGCHCPILYDAKLCWVHPFPLCGFLGLCVHPGASLRLHLGPLVSWISDPRRVKEPTEISRGAHRATQNWAGAAGTSCPELLAVSGTASLRWQRRTRPPAFSSAGLEWTHALHERTGLHQGGRSPLGPEGSPGCREVPGNWTGQLPEPPSLGPLPPRWAGWSGPRCTPSLGLPEASSLGGEWTPQPLPATASQGKSPVPP